MREFVINYFQQSLGKNIKEVGNVNFDKCVGASIELWCKDKNIRVVLNIDEQSLKDVANELFGIDSDEIIKDLIKEAINTIVGSFAEQNCKNYELGLPSNILCEKGSYFFEGDGIKLSLKVENGS